MMSEEEIKSLFQEWFCDASCESGIEGTATLYGIMLCTLKETFREQLEIDRQGIEDKYREAE